MAESKQGRRLACLKRHLFRERGWKAVCPVESWSGKEYREASCHCRKKFGAVRSHLEMKVARNVGTIKRVLTTLKGKKNIVKITVSPSRMWMVTSQTGAETLSRCFMHSLRLSSTLIPPIPVENIHCTKGHCKVPAEGKPCSVESKALLFHPKHCHLEYKPSYWEERNPIAVKTRAVRGP